MTIERAMKKEISDLVGCDFDAFQRVAESICGAIQEHEEKGNDGELPDEINTAMAEFDLAIRSENHK